MAENDELKVIVNESVEAGGTVDEIVDRAWKRIEKAGLIEKIGGAMLMQAVKSLVYACRGQRQHRLKYTGARRGAESAGMISTTVTRAMLDHWMVRPGLCLGDARRTDLQVARDKEQRLAIGHEMNVDFYDRVIEQIGNAKVRSKLTDAQATALWNEVMDQHGVKSEVA